MAQIGNTNASKTKVWADMIRKVATQSPDKMRKAAEKLLDMACEGDVQAMKEIGDRLDGKPKQQTEITGSEGGAIEIARIERIITDPSNTNA